MPYCTEYDRPKKDDVVWSNDGMLPADKKFDEGPENICTLGDATHQEEAAGYRYDPEIGWTLVCYEHAMEALDSDSIRAAEEKHAASLMTSFRNRAEEDLENAVSGAVEAGGATLVGTHVVPKGALCDRGDAHAGDSDSPPALVGLFPTKKKSKMKAAEFLCGPCALKFAVNCITVQQGDFEPFEMMPVAKKK